jgi:hypothetical protein
MPRRSAEDRREEFDERREDRAAISEIAESRSRPDYGANAPAVAMGRRRRTQGAATRRRPARQESGPTFGDMLEQLRERDKYKPNAESEEIIGVQQTPYSIIVLDDPGVALTETTFDSTSFSEGIEFLYTNSTGSSADLRGHVIRGKLVTRLSGEEGFLNDEFIDFEDIYENGENVLEIGNNMIVTRSQVDELAEYHAKWNFEGRHMYSVVMTGAQDWFEIGEWYTLDIAGPASKFEENIDSVVECIGVEIDAPVDRISTTVITFQEVYQNFQPTWNVAGKFYSIGAVQRTFSRGGVLRVSSSTDADTADYYCDGTDDDVQIQAAIDRMAAQGGGNIILSPGTFNISTSLSIEENVLVLGPGRGSTTISLTSIAGITMEGYSGIGSVGIYRASGTLPDVITITSGQNDVFIKDVAFDVTGVATVIKGGASKRILIQNVSILDSDFERAIDLSNTDDVVVGGVTIDNTGVSVDNVKICIRITGDNVSISDVVIRNIDFDINASTPSGIGFFGSNIVVSGVNIDTLNVASTSFDIRGIYCDTSTDVYVSNAIVKEVDNGTAANSFGVDVSGTRTTFTNVEVSGCSGTGVIVRSGSDRAKFIGGRTHNNGTDYTDNGTNTDATAAFETS